MLTFGNWISELPVLIIFWNLGDLATSIARCTLNLRPPKTSTRSEQKPLWNILLMAAFKLPLSWTLGELEFCFPWLWKSRECHTRTWHGKFTILQGLIMMSPLEEFDLPPAPCWVPRLNLRVWDASTPPRADADTIPQNSLT